MPRWNRWSRNVSACARPGSTRSIRLWRPSTPWSHPLTREQSLEELLRRPEMTYDALMAIEGGACIDRCGCRGSGGDPDPRRLYRASARRGGETAAQRNTLLPLDMNYRDVNGLSNEVIAKLNDAKPETIGQASRISGITLPPSPSCWCT